MSDLGRLAIAIEPDGAGFDTKLGGILASSKIGNTVKGAGKKAALAFGVGFGGAIAIGGFLAHLGSEFDKANDIIRTGTGKTGKALSSLEGSFRSVFSKVPASAEAVGQTVASISEKLGLSGKPLELLTKQFVNLSEVTGTDLGANVKGLTDLFNNWNVSGARTVSTTDMLFRASQRSGVAVGDLASQLTEGGVQLRQVGFDLRDSTSLIALLGKQGLSVSTVLPAIAKTMALAAKEGKPANQVFRDTFAAIRNAPDDTKAAGVALDVFGAKAGPKLGALIRSGKLSWEDFSHSLARGDSVDKAARATFDWQEKLKILTNNLETRLAPVAARVFDGIGIGVDWVSTHLDSAFGPRGIGTKAIAYFRGIAADVTAWFKSHWDQIGSVFSGVLEGGRKAVGDLARAFGASQGTILKVLGAITVGLVGLALAWNAGPGLIITGIVLLTAGLLYAYGRFSWFRDGVHATLAAVGAAFQTFSRAVSDVGQVLAKLSWGDIIRTAATDVGIAVDRIRQVVGGIVGFFQSHSKDFAAIGAQLVGIWRQLVPTLKAVWDAVVPIVKIAVGLIVGIVIVGTKLLTDLWNRFGRQMFGHVRIAFNSIVQVIRGALQIVRGVMEIITGVLTGKWGKAWQGVKDVFGGVWNVIVGLLKGVVNQLSTIIGLGMAVISEAWGYAWGGLKTVVVAIFDGIRSFIGRWWPLLLAPMTGGLSLVVKLFIDHFGQIKGFVSRTIDSVVGFFTGLPGRVVGAVGNLGSFVWNAIKSGWSTFTGGVSGVISGVVDYFTRAPGRFVAGLGIVGQTVWNGIKGTWSFLTAGISGVLDTIVAFFTGLPGRIASVTAHLWDGLASGLAGIWGGIERTMAAGVNIVIDIINGLIRAYNLIPFHKNTPDIPHVHFGEQSTPTFKPPPGRMAQGAVVSKPILTWLGEDPRTVPEIVSPLKLMRDTFRDVLRATQPFKPAIGRTPINIAPVGDPFRRASQDRLNDILEQIIAVAKRFRGPVVPPVDPGHHFGSRVEFPNAILNVDRSARVTFGATPASQVIHVANDILAQIIAVAKRFRGPIEPTRPVHNSFDGSFDRFPGSILKQPGHSFGPRSPAPVAPIRNESGRFNFARLQPSIPIVSPEIAQPILPARSIQHGSFDTDALRGSASVPAPSGLPPVAFNPTYHFEGQPTEEVLEVQNQKMATRLALMGRR